MSENYTTHSKGHNKLNQDKTASSSNTDEHVEHAKKWRSGQTVEQIAEETGKPASRVGKFLRGE